MLAMLERPALAVVAAVLLVALVGLSGCAAKAPRYAERSDNIVNGNISVSAGAHDAYRISVAAGMFDPRIVGSFTASGGSGNDIVVYVMDATAYTNYSNGHQVNTYYASGQLTTSSLDVGPLQPGDYYVVYDNSFSTISAKNVATRMDLKYQKRGS